MIAFDDATIRINGNLDRNSVADLVDIEIPFSKYNDWQVDLASAQRVDSAGLALLIDWAKRAQAHQVNLTVVNASEDFTGLMQLCKVEDLLSRR